MNSSLEQLQASDEINLFELFSNLWKNKITILLVSFLCGCLAFGLLLLTPEKYSGEFVLREPTGRQIAAYAPLNDGIKASYAEVLQNEKQDGEVTVQFEITTDGLFTEMVRELQDFEEFEAALKQYNSEYRDMSDEEFFEARSGLISNISIVPATELDPNARISFEWGNKNQLLDIFVMALLKAEENVNIGQLRMVSDLADNIERRALNERANLDSNLDSVEEAVDLATAGRLLFLKQQASIARELGLAENSLTNSYQENLFATVLDDGTILRDRPETLYLRGFKSLEKEIYLIETRVGDEKYLQNSEFLNAKRKILVLKNDVTVKSFRSSIKGSPFASGAKIFNIRKEAISVTKARSDSLILALSLMLGFFGSCVYVLMRDAFQRYTANEAA